MNDEDLPLQLLLALEEAPRPSCAYQKDKGLPIQVALSKDSNCLLPADGKQSQQHLANYNNLTELDLRGGLNPPN